MKEKKLIRAVLIGNTMEFYDFIVFAFMSKFISSLFFPNSNTVAAYLATFGVFASGYLMRPLGGLFFGYIGDKSGRKKSLSYSVIIITIATFCMGLLPTHASVGIIAPILLTVCRLLQGFSVSGEEGGAAVYLAEMVGEKRVAYAGSLVLGSAYFGVLLGSLACLLLSLIFTQDQIVAYAWRFPFFLSLLLGIPSLIMRRNLVESNAFNSVQKSNNPILELFSKSPLTMLADVSLVATLAIPIYLFTIFMPSYLQSIIKVPETAAQVISVLSLVFLSLGVPLLGKLADQFGKYKIFTIGCLVNIGACKLIFQLLASGVYFKILIGLLILGVGLLFVAGPMFAILMDRYNANVRFTAVSFVFNTSMSIFGSVTPLCGFYLIASYNNTQPYILLLVAGLIGLVNIAIQLKPFTVRAGRITTQ